MERRILKIQMLGCFSLEYDGKELVLDRNKVSKTTQLFQLILLHSQDGGISKVALIEALYGRSDVENKTAVLTTRYFGFESSYIRINGGMCTWDPDIKVAVDVMRI
ncbi:MAG: hypothetical protein ACLTX6_00270 [Lachnospiraceae bacterium]